MLLQIGWNQIFTFTLIATLILKKILREETIMLLLPLTENGFGCIQAAPKGETEQKSVCVLLFPFQTKKQKYKNSRQG